MTYAPKSLTHVRRTNKFRVADYSLDGIQVWHLNELTGVLCGHRADSMEVPFLSAKYSQRDSIHCDTIAQMKWLNTQVRFCEIPSSDVVDEKSAMHYKELYKIPNYAKKTVGSDMRGNQSIRFSWRVLNVDIEDLEEMFDADEFIAI